MSDVTGQERIFDELYWRTRLADAIGKGEVHRSIFRCTLPEWLSIEEKHKEILKKHVKRDTSILDCGCGWGRLLTLLPGNWRGHYLGCDISPDFISVARNNHPGKLFTTRDLRHPMPVSFVVGDGIGRVEVGSFDIAVFVSIRPMVIRYAGQEEWNRIERNVRKVAHSLLYLEYDVNDVGELVIVE